MAEAPWAPRSLVRFGSLECPAKMLASTRLSFSHSVLVASVSFAFCELYIYCRSVLHLEPWSLYR